MSGQTHSYPISELPSHFGQGWNTFWLSKASPLPAAVLRIAVGSVVTILFCSYLFDGTHWFGGNGILSPTTLGQLNQDGYGLSLLTVIPTTWWVLVCVLLAIGFSVGMTLGLFSRVTTVGTLVMLLSFIHAGPLLVSQAEPLLAVLMFYICWLPTGRVLSLDAWRQKQPPNKDTVQIETSEAKASIDAAADEISLCCGDLTPSLAANIPLRMIQVHFAAIIGMAALSMLSSLLWRDGSSLWWLASLKFSRLVDLTGISFAYLWNGAAFFAFAVNLLFAILVWYPAWRRLMLLLLLLVWAGITLLTGNVLLLLTISAALLAFVDPGQLGSWVSRCCGGICAAKDSAVTPKQSAKSASNKQKSKKK